MFSGSVISLRTHHELHDPNPAKWPNSELLSVMLASPVVACCVFACVRFKLYFNTFILLMKLITGFRARPEEVVTWCIVAGKKWREKVSLQCHMTVRYVRQWVAQLKTKPRAGNRKSRFLLYFLLYYNERASGKCWDHGLAACEKFRQHTVRLHDKRKNSREFSSRPAYCSTSTRTYLICCTFCSIHRSLITQTQPGCRCIWRDISFCFCANLRAPYEHEPCGVPLLRYWVAYPSCLVCST